MLKNYVKFMFLLSILIFPLNVYAESGVGISFYGDDEISPEEIEPETLPPNQGIETLPPTGDATNVLLIGLGGIFIGSVVLIQYVRIKRNTPGLITQ